MGQNAPWHTWGNSGPLTIDGDAIQASGGRAQSEQLVQIEYHRPESWGFFFFVKLLEFDRPDIASPQILVNFDLLLGVGRSQSKVTNFAAFIFDVSTTDGIGSLKWAATVQQPEAVTGAGARQPCDRIVSQTLQCVAT